MWPNEAQNFTPWLAENIAELGEKIGMELEVLGQEVSVGPYSADILAKDIDTDAYVVIVISSLTSAKIALFSGLIKF